MEFKFNNLLYKHVRAKKYLLKTLIDNTLITFYRSFEIILLNVLITNLRTGFEFRNYYFLTLFVALKAYVIAILVYLDSNYFVILINCAFLLE